MTSDYEKLSKELQDIYGKIKDADDARMGERGFILTGYEGDNEQFNLMQEYNEILEKMRLLEENENSNTNETSNGGRYRKKHRKSKKHRRTKKQRKSRKSFFGLF